MRRAHNHESSRKPEFFRRLLQDKKAELLGSLEDARFDTLARMGRVAEEDQAQISHEEFISVRRNSMDYEKLRLVQEAMDRLTAGDFGVCQECEEPISEKRLNAVPWARLCISCQERASDGGMETPVLAEALSNW